MKGQLRCTSFCPQLEPYSYPLLTESVRYEAENYLRLKLLAKACDIWIKTNSTRRVLPMALA